MEKLRAVWDFIAPFLAGGVTSLIIQLFVIPFLRGKITKGFAKIDFKKFLADAQAVFASEGDRIIARIKGMVMTHSIEPLVMSEMQKVNENATALVKGTCDKIHAENAALLNVLAAQAAYFDDSTVGTEKKAALHAAIEEAQGRFAPQTVEAVVEVAEIVEAPAPKKTVRKVEVVR